MTTSESQLSPGRYEVPESAWALGWLFLADQVVRLFVEGPGEDNYVVLSVIFGAVVVTFFSYGVVTARPIRVAIVWIALALALLGELHRLVVDPTIWHAFRGAVSGAQLWAFLVFRQTSYFAWQKTRPAQGDEDLGGLMLMAVAVGVLGGIIGANGDGFNVRVNF